MSGAEQAENRVERSGERALQKTMEREWSTEWEVSEWEQSGERGVTEVGWSAEQLFRRSHTLLTNLA